MLKLFENQVKLGQILHFPDFRIVFIMFAKLFSLLNLISDSYNTQMICAKIQNRKRQQLQNCIFLITCKFLLRLGRSNHMYQMLHISCQYFHPYIINQGHTTTVIQILEIHENPNLPPLSQNSLQFAKNNHKNFGPSVVHIKHRDSPYLDILNVGTVPMLCILYVGTAPTLWISNVGTVPTFSSSHI